MPGGNGTGPIGLGPMTGGGRGYCAVPYPGRGRGPFAGRGFGRGRGWRYWQCATGIPGWARVQRGWPAFGGEPYPYSTEMTANEEVDMLREETESLKAELSDIQGRICDLEKTKGSKGNG